MKKIITILLVLITANIVSAETVLLETNVNERNYWEKNSIETKKVMHVGRNLIHANNLKRAPLKVERNWRVPNAATYQQTKYVVINTGILYYFENDDELAFVIGHELAHAQELYDGVTKIVAMSFNSKKYEYKADLLAIDYMVKAGYNPIAGIIVTNKISPEPIWDWGCLNTHPKGTSRMIKMYEYIYKKYPQYLSSDMTKSPTYLDFTKQCEKELNSFHQKQAKKNYKDNNVL